MSTMRRVVMAGALVTFAVAVVCGCGKKSTNPPPPGGSSELNSPTLNPGDTWVHTFANAGTYGYHCSIHSQMTASVTVTDGGPDSAVVNIRNFEFVPPSVTIARGKYVRWTNEGGLHTVTSH